MLLGLRATATLTYSRLDIVPVPHQIFRTTVQDTSQYHRFVPWCRRSEVKHISPLENYTKLTISFHDLGEISYNSHVHIIQQRKKCIITSLCTDHPLRHLQSVWDIEAETEHSAKVKYSLDFQFNSILYQLTSRAFLNFMGQNMWDTFVARAKEVYKQSQSTETNKANTQNSSAVPNEHYDADHCLYKYLKGRPELQQMLQKDHQLAQEVTSISRRIAGTSNFQAKISFELRNSLIRRGIFPRSHDSKTHDIWNQLL